jgi:hypothetical protein
MFNSHQVGDFNTWSAFSGAKTPAFAGKRLGNGRFRGSADFFWSLPGTSESFAIDNLMIRKVAAIVL